MSREAAVSRLVRTWFAVGVALGPVVAQAYPGQRLVEWARNYIVAPLAVIMIILAVGAALFRPEAAKQAGYVAIVAVVLFLIMSQAGAIITALQS